MTTGARLPVSALFENLESGATIERFMEWFKPVDEWKVRAVLQHVADSLKLPVPAGQSHLELVGTPSTVTPAKSLPRTAIRGRSPEGWVGRLSQGWL